MQTFNLFAALNVTLFFNRTFNLERHLTTCSERVKNVHPRNVCQIRETLFDKLDSFGIKYTSEQKLSELAIFSKNLAIFDFESICVQEETLRDTNTTTWTGKHVPRSVTIFQNLWRNHFSSATLILITSLHLLLELLKN